MEKITKNYCLKLLMFTVVFAVFMQPAVAKVWYVGTPTQWVDKDAGDLFATVQDAYAAAAATGDEIWIAEGVYTVPSLTIKSVAIYGGFVGTESSIGEREKAAGGKPWEFAYPAVIKNSAAQVFNKTTSTANTFIVDGITFDGDNVSPRRAININPGNITSTNRISNCIFKNYSMNGDGATMNIRDKTEIYNCLITGNKNAGNSTIYLDYGSIIHDCEITNNSVNGGGAGIAANGMSGSGAASYMISIYNCLIANNVSNSGAGGIASNNARIHDCVIVNNTGSSAGGIGFDCRFTSVVWNVTVANNKTTSATTGGIVFNTNSNTTNSGTKTVVNSIVYNNTNSNGDVMNFSETNHYTSAKTVQNCIIDGADYGSVATFTDNIVPTDFTDIFTGTDSDDTNWITKPDLALDKGVLTIPNASLTLTAEVKDFAGGPRVWGNSADIGPYELIPVGTVGADGINATVTAVTFNGAPAPASGFYAVYGDVLKIYFTKTKATPACNVPGAIITTDNDDCVATIVISQPLGDITVTSGTQRTVTVNYPESITHVSTQASGDNPYIVADGSSFVLTFQYSEHKSYQPVTDAGTITGTQPDYTLTVPSITSDTTINIIVNAITVTDVTLNKSAVTLSFDNLTDHLVATVTPSNALNKNIKWSSSDPDIVQVADNGRITPLGAGSAIITVTAEDGGLEASCAVAVAGNIKAYAFEPLEDTYADSSTPSTALGASEILTVSHGGAGYIRYAYLKFSIEDVMEQMKDKDPESLRTALSLWMVGHNNANSFTSAQVNGDAQWKLYDMSDTDWSESSTTWSNYTDWNNNALTTVSGTMTEVASRNVMNFTNVTDHNMRAVFDLTDYALQQDADQVDVVSLTLRPGTANLSAGARFASKENVDAAKHPLMVISYVGVESVELDETELALDVVNNPAATLAATVLPDEAYNKNVTWSSSEPSIATVSDSGEVTAMASGSATITATTVDGVKTADCNVTVTNYTGLTEVAKGNKVISVKFYTITGIEVPAPATTKTGNIFIKKTVFDNGKTIIDKIIF